MTAEMNAARKAPLPALLLVLSGVTGLVDAISILGMGKVFTANMTGNITFLGFAIGGAPHFEMAPLIVAIAAFVVGAWIGGHLGKPFDGAPHRNWVLRVACIEAGLFWAAAVVALGYDYASLTPASHLYGLIALTAVAMGLRNATVRQFKVPDLTTTVLTLTLTGLAADSHFAGGTNPNWQRRLGSVFAVFAGAVIGAVLVTWTGLVVPLVLTGVIVLAATVGYALHPATHGPAPVRPSR